MGPSLGLTADGPQWKMSKAVTNRGTPVVARGNRLSKGRVNRIEQNRVHLDEIFVGCSETATAIGGGVRAGARCVQRIVRQAG
jgi:hypothetical protein